MRRFDRGGVLLLMLLFSTALAAQTVLDDYTRIQPQLQPSQRAQLRQRAATWTGWTAAERADFGARAAAWDALAPSQRGEHRERYFAWQALPTKDRIAVRAAMDRYAALPADQQETLRAQFDALDRSNRRGWLLGPSLGADYAALQPLLAQVPAADHEVLLRVLRAMTRQQRIELAMLVQRTPPHERDELRRALVSTSASNRQQWLWLRLER
ncbi:MAG: DUF3106 domain-containing protein [Lysobacter sp.]